MHATLTPTDPVGEHPALVRRLVGPAETLVVAVWASEDEARAAAAGGEVWQVADHHQGPASAEQPVAAQVTVFRGPRSAQQVAADIRAGRESLWPALHDTPGLVDVLVLRADDGGFVVVGTTTGAEHFAEVNRRVMSTTLLPGEDPTLLAGPDRLESYVVTSSTGGAR